MLTCFHGHQIDLGTLRRRHPASLNGVTLRSLIQVANHLDLACRPLRYELKHLRQLRLPAILHWDMNHFVILKSVSRKGITIHDPACGQRFFPIAEASKHLSGVALEVSPTTGFSPRNERARLPFSVFWAQLSGSGHALVQVFVLALLLQLFVLAGPFYMQITIDEVIARGDVDLLVVLALGFALLALMKATATALRSSVLLVLQNVVQFQLGARLFRHLIRLPISYFEKRHIGDVLSRFSSLQPIRNLLAEGLVAAVLDGIMAVLTLIMMLVYSIQLAAVVLVAVVLYATVRLALYRVLWRRTEALIQTQANENSTFIETLRGIQTLKLYNRESEREGQWLNRYADVVNANVHVGRARIAFTTINDVIFGLETVITVYLAARLALSNSLTVGAIFAFVSYKQHFMEKTVQLVEKALDFRILGLHLERLADIALTEPEHGYERPLAYTREIQGRLELRNVFFRYSESDPFVLENVNLTIEPGEFVTIMGPSGGGKTTLVKIMLGLLEPTSGHVLVDGIPLTTFGERVYREQVAAVMQEDQLLSGSIADNICFFDSEFDQERMIRCTQHAGIHDEIMAMPMTYNSLVGDMGSSLSAGQKQRLFLARALYRQPRMLFLDEGTAHLDLQNERSINESLQRLQITRVSVAHRPDIASGADRILHLARTLQAAPNAITLVPH
jgi:ATP-binding cassette subfamily B protein RaxB